MHCLIMLLIFVVLFTARTSLTEEVTFLIGTGNGVLQSNSTNLDIFEKISELTDGANTVDYHLGKNLLLAVSGNKLYKTTLDPKTTYSRRMLVSIQCFFSNGLAVDWVHDRIYWTDCSLLNNSRVNIIKSIDLNGGTESLVFSDLEERALIMSVTIDPYCSKMFWTVDGVVESCDLTGNNFQTNISATGVIVWDLALDLASQRIYYVGSINRITSVYSMNYEGRDTQDHFSTTEMELLFGFGLVRGSVYWGNWHNGRHAMYTAPIESISERRVEMLKVFDQAVWHMRVVHPDLQRKPKHYPCQYRGCEYRCVTLNYSAQCECPEGQELKENGAVSSEQHKDENVIDGSGRHDTIIIYDQTIRFAIMVIIMAIMTAAVALL